MWWRHRQGTVLRGKRKAVRLTGKHGLKIRYLYKIPIKRDFKVQECRCFCFFKILHLIMNSSFKAGEVNNANPQCGSAEPHPGLTREVPEVPRPAPRVPNCLPAPLPAELWRPRQANHSRTHCASHRHGTAPQGPLSTALPPRPETPETGAHDSAEGPQPRPTAVLSAWCVRPSSGW